MSHEDAGANPHPIAPSVADRTEVQCEQRTGAWHKARLGRLTGSRIAAALGLSPYGTAEALAARLIDERKMHAYQWDLEPTASSPSMARGIQRESAILGAWLQAHGNEQCVFPGFFTCTLHLQRGNETAQLAVGCSPDAIAHCRDDKVMLEAKWTGMPTIRDATYAYWAAQASFNALLTDCNAAYVVYQQRDKTPCWRQCPPTLTQTQLARLWAFADSLERAWTSARALAQL